MVTVNILNVLIAAGGLLIAYFGFVKKHDSAIAKEAARWACFEEHIKHLDTIEAKIDAVLLLKTDVDKHELRLAEHDKKLILLENKADKAHIRIDRNNNEIDTIKLHMKKNLKDGVSKNEHI